MKYNQIIIWLLRIVAVAIMMQTLYFKFTAHPQSVALFTMIGMEPYGRILIGVLELIASILILIPRLTGFGALLGIGLMSGALYFHFAIIGIEFDGDYVLFYYAGVVFMVCLILLIIFRKQVINLLPIMKKYTSNIHQIFIVLMSALLFSNCSYSQNKQVMPIKKNQYYSKDDTTKLNVHDKEWQQVLDPFTYSVAREKATERPFTGEFWDHKDVGLYRCKACGNALFRSNGKFESSCGWPSFFEPYDASSVKYVEDNSHGMQRVEVICGRCDAHLGHIFDDGPPPTYKRYCINSVIIDFEKK